jgi:hypothetical protein
MKTTIHALLFAGLVFSAAAGAGEPLDTANIDDPEVHAASCRAVDWDEELLTAYPRLSEACHEVILSGGERWARFETELVQVNRSGSVKSNFLDRQGSNMGAITIMPARGQRVTIEGREYAFSELRPGQVLNIYVPEGANSFALAPRAPAEQHVEVVEIQPEPAGASNRMASTRTLPKTAGPLPMLVIGGVLALLAGLGFTVRRRYLTARK